MIQKGYTLIELLVGISIIAIIFGVGFVSYREFSRRQSLTGVTKQLVGDLRLAQQLALTGQKPESGLCTTLIGYTVSRTSTTTYDLIANCSNANYIIKTINMPVNTTISAGSVTFKVLGQGTNLTSPLTYTVTNTSASTSGIVTIGIGGDIK
ncbi:MAG: prepilin-type N-terminal cleavage/methylation domain-containing protein [Patescibacteria group bacterium]